MANLASEENAAKINLRFKELELEILSLRKEISVMHNNQSNMQELINKQTEMIQQAWVSQHGNGATVGA